MAPIPQGCRLWEGRLYSAGVGSNSISNPVLEVLVPREGLTAAGVPGAHPGCPAGSQPSLAVPAALGAPGVAVSPFPRSPVRGTIELGMNRLLVYY